MYKKCITLFLLDLLPQKTKFKTNAYFCELNRENDISTTFLCTCLK